MSYEASLTTELLSRNLFSVVFESVLFLFINIVAIVGNVFVILAICRNTALRKITNWYILSLSISDLFVSVTCMPLSLVVIMKGKWLYGDVTCQFQGHVMQIWGCFSLTIVAATAFNRVRFLKGQFALIQDYNFVPPFVFTFLCIGQSNISRCYHFCIFVRLNSILQARGKRTLFKIWLNPGLNFNNLSRNGAQTPAVRRTISANTWLYRNPGFFLFC